MLIELERPAARQRKAQPHVQDHIPARPHAVGIGIELAPERRFQRDLGDPWRRRRLDAKVDDARVVQAPCRPRALAIESQFGPHARAPRRGQPDAGPQLALDGLAALLPGDGVGQRAHLVQDQVGLELVELDPAQRLRPQDAVDRAGGAGDAGLRHEAVVIDEPGRDRLHLGFMPPAFGLVQVLAPHVAAGAPCHPRRHIVIDKAGRGARQHGHAGQLALHAIVAFAAPLRVHTDHVIAAEAVVVAL